MKKPDGGPAFPVKVENVLEYPRNSVPREIEHTGMTLRQWYAGLAMQHLVHWWLETESGLIGEKNLIAKEAHDMADAMIAYEESESNA